MQCFRSVHKHALSHSITLSSYANPRTHIHALSLSLSPLSLSLSLSLSRSLAHPLTLFLSHTCTCTISLEHQLLHSNCTHWLSLQVVCLLSLLLAVFCVHSLHLRRTYVCHFSLSTNAHAPFTPTPGRMGGLLFKPIFFHLIPIRICRACAPLSLSLVLAPSFRYVVSDSQLRVTVNI